MHGLVLVFQLLKLYEFFGLHGDGHSQLLLGLTFRRSRLDDRASVRPARLGPMGGAGEQSGDENDGEAGGGGQQQPVFMAKQSFPSSVLRCVKRLLVQKTYFYL
ncbi:MAG: hypothetical protein K0R28_5205, partial [Paenibacillus sp.]|nr:hypothetical protein [Paenibacillus sp.]